MKNYFVYDGRAHFDVEEAMIVESFQAKNESAAIKYFKREYTGYDYVLTDEYNEFLDSAML